MQTLSSQSTGADRLADDAIAALVATHDRDARDALRRVLGRSQEEDDLVQEVFVRLLIRLRQPGPIQVGAWVRGVAHNLAVDEIRRRRAVPVDEAHLDASVPSGADERLDGGELYAKLVAGARCLPDRQRAALAAVLGGDSGSGVAGVASQLGVSVHAAESLISRARSGLRHHLAAAGASRDDGSVRVGAGAVLGTAAVLWAWIARYWRAMAVAGAVATASVTAGVTLHDRRMAPALPAQGHPLAVSRTAGIAPPEASMAPTTEESADNPPPATMPTTVGALDGAAPGTAVPPAGVPDLALGSLCSTLDAATPPTALAGPLADGLVGPIGISLPGPCPEGAGAQATTGPTG